MKVILLKDVENLGDEASIVRVSDGYARNYLFPKKLAKEATDSSLRELDRKRNALEAKYANQKDGIKKTKEMLDSCSIEINADSGPDGKLFGSITKADIISEIKQKIKADFDKKMVLLDQPIKIIGDYKVQIKLSPDFEATINLRISPSK